MKGGKKQFERDDTIEDDYAKPRNAKGAMRSGPPRLAVWEQNSRDTVEEQQFVEAKRKAAEYSFKKPWDQQSKDVADEMQRHVEALDYTIVPPWTEGSEIEDADLDRKLAAISGYEYEPLWKPVEQTIYRQQQFANYKIDPPFQTQLTPISAAKKPAKRILPGHNSRTLPPWEHGKCVCMLLCECVCERECVCVCGRERVSLFACV